FICLAGCCMHKELNTAKGGAVAMAKFWQENNLVGPLMLPNKGGVAAIAGGIEPASPSQGGGIKVAGIAGAIFAHRDDKKGEQDAINVAFEAKFGYPLAFPKTNSTHYQSYCDAGADLILHLTFYQNYIELMKDRKDSRTLNNMEKNLQMALQDIPTLHELYVLALFSAVISWPYMLIVHGEGQEDQNILDMGPIHAKFAAYMQSIIADPMIILTPGADFRVSSLDGQPWMRVNVMFAVWQLVHTLLHLPGLTIAFFNGALETWERFTEEFAPGGLISSMSPKQRKLAWMPPTNDVNEGALGARRVIKRSYPKSTELTLNARQRYK
ncbi:hypothetical protein M422DRAFT_191005, partial [Sphaerobolus stellatus SS14]